jgi:hypothetical protein
VKSHSPIASGDFSASRLAAVETGADQLSDENLEVLFVEQLKLFEPSLNAQKTYVNITPILKKSTTANDHLR